MNKVLVQRWCSAFRKALLIAALAATVFVGKAVADDGADANGMRIDQILQQVGIKPQFGKRIPLDLTFTNADGKSVRLADLLKDQPVILHLVYYQCPMLCKLSTDGLFRALDTLTLTPGRDFSVITLSFDPREGPDLSARARQVAMERFDRTAVAEGWSFLTGEQAAIKKLCNAVGFYYKFDEQKGQFAHASGIFVLTPDGTISRYLSGVEYSPRDLRLALVEASRDKIGTASDQVLLLCYMYDPTNGKYGLAIMTVLRTAGALTVAGLVLTIGLLIRREHRRAPTNEPAEAAIDQVATE
jgi:protein SCO1/2